MPDITLPSFAKLNLSLKVLGKRPDGFHEILTVFQTISLSDDLTFEAAKEISVECDDARVPTGERNLVIKAVRALSQKTGIRRGVRIGIKKRIPSPGGLGGGSSNAAVTLLAVSRLWELGLSPRELVEIGCELGADVPFFLCGGTAIGSGRGTAIDPICDLSLTDIVVVSPELDISTPEAYSALGFTDLTKKYPKSILEHYRQAADGLITGRFDFVNDFESFVFSEYPVVREAAGRLRAAGAQVVLLSGSGPSVFGIFESSAHGEKAIKELEKNGANRCYAVKTVSRQMYTERLGMS